MTSAVNCHLTFVMTILSAQSAEQKTAESRTTIKIYFKFSYLVNPLCTLHASTVTTRCYTHFSCCSHFFWATATLSVWLLPVYAFILLTFMYVSMATEWKKSTVGYKMMWHKCNLKGPTYRQYTFSILFFSSIGWLFKNNNSKDLQKQHI